MNTRKANYAVIVVMLAAVCLSACGKDLQVWHTKILTAEFTANQQDEVADLEQYLILEDALFGQLDAKIYARTPHGPEYALQRYSRGSAADPQQQPTNWNRTFVLSPEKPIGGVLLLHGMSDSPYSLRRLGQALYQEGYLVLGLRLPGHGTIPSGITLVHWRDMAAAAKLGMRHLHESLGKKPVHIVGYSTGAALALDYSLEADPQSQAASLVLISPAIAISNAAGFASWMRGMSRIPGLNQFAWTQVEPEFDPYKYNSFSTNAAEQVHLLTRSVSRRLQQRLSTGEATAIPPMLVIKSTVDATVSNSAVVDKLLGILPPANHELMLFDINRLTTLSSLLVSEQGDFTKRLIRDASLPFALTLIANTSPGERTLQASYKPPMHAQFAAQQALKQAWPIGVLSLSHVALPFAPDDPLYGSAPPTDKDQLFLGAQSVQGERGIMRISAEYLFRLRYNPFYDYMQQRVSAWILSPGSKLPAQNTRGD